MPVYSDLKCKIHKTKMLVYMRTNKHHNGKQGQVYVYPVYRCRECWTEYNRKKRLLKVDTEVKKIILTCLLK